MIARGGGGSLGSNKTQTLNHLAKPKLGVWKSAAGKPIQPGWVDGGWVDSGWVDGVRVLGVTPG